MNAISQTSRKIPFIYPRYLTTEAIVNPQGSKFTSKNCALKSVYSKVCVYKDRSAFVNDLLSNAVHLDPKGSGLVALNKPAGIPIKPLEDSQFSLDGAIPLIAKELGVERLHRVRAPERYSSGLTLLSASDSGLNRIKRCLRRHDSADATTLKDVYLALTNGFPRKDDVTETVDIVVTNVGIRKATLKGNHFEPVIHRMLHSKQRLTKKDQEKIVRVKVHSHVVSKSPFGAASLVSVHPSLTANHFIEVYMADLLSPVVGDGFYSYRAKTIMGVMTKVPETRSPHIPKEVIVLLANL